MPKYKLVAEFDKKSFNNYLICGDDAKAKALVDEIFDTKVTAFKENSDTTTASASKVDYNNVDMTLIGGGESVRVQIKVKIDKTSNDIETAFKGQEVNGVTVEKIHFNKFTPVTVT